MSKIATKKKTSIEKLDTAVSKILSEYADDIENNIDIITKKMGQKGAVALRQSSKERLKQHTGEYAKGWKYEYRKTRRYSQTIIFNEHYSKPHLLELGHVTKNGDGRIYEPTPPHEHIKPVADEVTSTYEKEVRSKI